MKNILHGILRLMAANYPFADEIKRLRKAMNMTQSAFAYELGVEQATVSRWEKGAEPSFNRITDIANLAIAKGLSPGFVNQDIKIGFSQQVEETADYILCAGFILPGSIVGYDEPDVDKYRPEFYAPQGASPEAVAFILKSDEYLPLIAKNTVLFFNQLKTAKIEEAHNIFVLAATAHEGQFVGRILRSSRRGRHHLISPSVQRLDLEIKSYREFLGITISHEG